MICRARALMLAVATTAFSLAYTEAPSRDCQAVGAQIKRLKSKVERLGDEIRRLDAVQARRWFEQFRLLDAVARSECDSSPFSPAIRLHCRGLRNMVNRNYHEIRRRRATIDAHRRQWEVDDNRLTRLVEDNLVCRGSIGCTTDFRHIPNQAIAGNNLYSLSNLSVNQCKAKCRANPRCMSFDYGKRTGLCVISDKDSGDVKKGGARWARPAGRSDWPYDYYERRCR